MTYRSGDVLPEHGMSLVFSHVKQTFILSEAASDVVAGLVGIAVIDLWELGVVADQQQSGGNSNNGS